VALSLHDSAKEVGEMARQFLLDFSDSSLRNIDSIMRNFSKSRCPQPNEVESEFDDVTKNRLERRILNFSIGNPTTTIEFGARCPFAVKRGDACAVVPVFWADIDLATNLPSTTRANDIVATAYASEDSRWWLCASNYQATSTIGKPFFR
jgi:hypothetical protein